MAASTGQPAPDAAGGSTSTGHVAVNIDALVNSIEQEMLQQNSAVLWQAPSTGTLVITISKVDEQTRAVDEDEYTPHDVPIGPYHRDRLPSQQRTDEEKLRLLSYVLGRVVTSWGTRVVLSDLLEEMEKLDVEGKASACYAHRSFGMYGSEFVRMLLLDGCYLLACFVNDLDGTAARSAAGGGSNDESGVRDTAAEVPATRSAAGGGSNDESGVRDTAAEVPATRSAAGGGSNDESGVRDTAAEVPATRSAAGGGRNDEGVVRDSFYLLENQIPFTVLEKIYERVTGRTGGDVVCKLTDRVQELLRDRLYIGETPEYVTTPESESPDHLLHLVYQQFTLANDPPQTQAKEYCCCSHANVEFGSDTGRWRRATEYCSRANVRFERRVFSNGAKWSVLDVSLVGRTLRMPRLRVDPNTWTILRNLMALEQLPRCSSTPRVTAYCLFMSQVACTAEDVELLGRAGVVEHFLGSDAEAAAGFANLCKGVVLNVDDPDINYLKHTWHVLERRYKSRRHNLEAWFRQTHCRNQCYAAAFVVAVILFACQVLQAVFAVKTGVRPT